MLLSIYIMTVLVKEVVVEGAGSERLSVDKVPLHVLVDSESKKEILPFVAKTHCQTGRQPANLLSAYV